MNLKAFAQQRKHLTKKQPRELEKEFANNMTNINS